MPDVGISAEQTPLGVLEGNRFDLVLTRVEGPGDFFHWTTGGTGIPILHMNSADGLSAADRYEVPAGSHTHMNTGFTSPGTYQLGLVAQGTPAGGSTLLQGKEALYQFEVSVLKRGEVDGLGVPNVAINTRDGLTSDDVFTLQSGQHVHANWAFSEPGVYRLTFAAEGVLLAGQEPVSGQATLRSDRG